jgi:hypothetical protein
MSWVATAIVGSAVVGGASSAYAANQAAQTQSNAAQAGAAAQVQAAQIAANTSLNMYGQTQQREQPFVGAGVGGVNALNAALPGLTSGVALPTTPTFANAPGAPTLPGNVQPMTQAQLEATPGYQFNLTQGEKAIQNSAAARGLGTSGAALKGATTFATGLADSTYQNQFNNQQTIFQNALNLSQTGFQNQNTSWQNQINANQLGFANANTNFANTQTNQSNAYSRLMGIINTGQNAAANVGSAGTNAANTAANASIAGGNAVQAGLVGSANAQAAGINATGAAVGNVANAVGGYAMYQGMYGGNNNTGTVSSLNQIPQLPTGGYAIGAP